jgi:hypothetical protein
MPGTKMPTLEEVFDVAAASKVQLNIETKIDPKTPELTPDPATFARLVVGLIRKHGMEQRVIVPSFDFLRLSYAQRGAGARSGTAPFGLELGHAKALCRDRQRSRKQ